MKEHKLKEYFENTLTAEQLSADLKDSQERTSYDVTSVSVEQIKEGEFEIIKQHLIKLCDDVLNGKLLTSDLNTIGFTLMASEYFYWDGSNKDGQIISDVIFDWDNPEIGYDLTIDNTKLWRDYLVNGHNNFSKEELKKKLRGDGKTK